MGITVALTACTSLSLLVVIAARIVVLIQPADRDTYDQSLVAFAICQGVFALFLIASLCFLGVSLLMLVVQSSRLVTSSSGLKRQIFAGALCNGIISLFGVGVLTYLRNYFILGLYVSGWAIFSWIIYRAVSHVLRKRLTSTAILSPILTVIDDSANRVLAGLVVLIIAAVYFVIAFQIGKSQRNPTVLGPVSTSAIYGLFVSFIFLLAQTVRSVEYLGDHNRYASVEVRPKPARV
jgi:hypothetical protein